MQQYNSRNLMQKQARLKLAEEVPEEVKDQHKKNMPHSELLKSLV